MIKNIQKSKVATYLSLALMVSIYGSFANSSSTSTLLKQRTLRAQAMTKQMANQMMVTSCSSNTIKVNNKFYGCANKPLIE